MRDAGQVADGVPPAAARCARCRHRPAAARRLHLSAAPLSAAEFEFLIGGLGPFAARPRLAVAVSGGADSLALAALADGWARARGGEVRALVVDHGLRAASAVEADLTVRRLAAMGIAARLLPLQGLRPGAALAARARDARYAALASACAELGLIDLLLGHHAADQAETLMMRSLSGTAAAGFSGIAAQRETHALRLLRPLLTVPPARLRATLGEAGLDWVEDPSNADGQALRGRIRAARAPDDGALGEAAAAAGARRSAADLAIAELLAQRVSLHPEGYARLTPGRLPAAALAALLRAISGAAWPVSTRRVARLAWAPAPATLAGVRLLASGGGLLLLREAAAQAPPVPAGEGAVWDGRFRLLSPGLPGGLPGATIGALGADAARWRCRNGLPAAVLRVLPAIRRDGEVVAVPHLGYVGEAGAGSVRLLFCPAEPVCGAPWFGAPRKTGAIGDA